ncbi:TetR/AcrR family transcriptional regulator [Aquisalimonas asiatica]|uniref:Transcriptional regulator, TetR family n=1 Tax=Aquisalimonas asiatica TaxID=406100 RepID=A0A1H8TFJ3_9GAMM|nr:TetR/AcrR family transcriptional regulator [Aquisalimonas asiatica]SEO89651.1 transcriptional regulator, TetR family [Aquisalimonas asiatica]
MSQQISPGHTSTRTEAAKRILTAARLLFTERGFEGVSIRDIAARADVSKANVFHHFRNKAALYDAVLEDSRLTFDGLLVDLADHELPLRDRLERFLRDDLRTMLRDPSSVNLFLRQMLNSAGNPQRRRAEDTITEGMNDLLQTMAEARQKQHAHTATPDSTLALTLTLLGSAFMYFQLRDVLPRLDDAGERCDPDRYCAEIMALLHPGLTCQNDRTD